MNCVGARTGRRTALFHSFQNVVYLKYEAQESVSPTFRVVRSASFLLFLTEDSKVWTLEMKNCSFGPRSNSILPKRETFKCDHLRKGSSPVKQVASS